MASSPGLTASLFRRLLSGELSFDEAGGTMEEEEEDERDDSMASIKAVAIDSMTRVTMSSFPPSPSPMFSAASSVAGEEASAPAPEFAKESPARSHRSVTPLAEVRRAPPWPKPPPSLASLGSNSGSFLQCFPAAHAALQSCLGLILLLVPPSSFASATSSSNTPSARITNPRSSALFSPVARSILAPPANFAESVSANTRLDSLHHSGGVSSRRVRRTRTDRDRADPFWREEL
mmetsp:Transcript_39701/g.119301  ORF Transcript_39701/g.119301 Transcript_39701/m.119301 type:complete len:234 (+) Transcript_39701:156-857(+)